MADEVVPTINRANWSSTWTRYQTLRLDTITCPHGVYAAYSAVYPTGQLVNGAAVAASEYRNHQVMTNGCGCVLVVPAPATLAAEGEAA